MPMITQTSDVNAHQLETTAEDEAQTMHQPTHTRGRIIAATVIGASLMGVASPAMASAAPADNVRYTLTNSTSTNEVDITNIVNDPTYADLDMTAILDAVADNLVTHGIYLNEIHDGTATALADTAPASYSGQSETTSTSTSNNGIVAAAESVRGTPYVWGGSTPAGFDCSGLVQWAYAQNGKSIPRTSYEMAAQGQPVSRENIQPGDIVVYYEGASHVGIYAGNGQIIDSLGDGYVVDYRPIDYMPIHSIVRF